LKVSEDKLPQAQALAAAARPMSAIQAEAIGAMSGLIGDDLAKQRNPIVPRLGFYRDGQRLRLQADDLQAAFPEATGRIAIFLHGLCGSEHTWSYFQTPGNAETLPYSERLHTDLGFTPVMLRYNSGLSISLNGRSLARAVEKLLQAWPLPVQDVVLIGHSMGGLLARSAVYAASKSQFSWTKQLRHVVCLGSPHTGAPLERIVNRGVAWMHKLPLSRPLAKVLDVRSAGIRHLGHGFIVDEDHKGRSRESLNADSRTPIPPLATAQYHFLGTTLGSGPDSYWSETLGDGLVQLSSSTAAHLANADSATLYASNHMRLLNHPAIYQQLRQRLGAPAGANIP
jgi:pimeloyl-ACP methyl ester carboxylesterase